MPSTVPTPEPYTMHTYVCLPHTSTSVPTQAPAVPTTLDWIMHTSSPHAYSHRHVSTYRCIAMPFTSAPLSLHHAHIRASLTALTPIYTHTAPCHAYHTRSRDLGPAWEYMLRPVPCMGLYAATWGLHGTMCCDLGPAWDCTLCPACNCECSLNLPIPTPVEGWPALPLPCCAEAPPVHNVVFTSMPVHRASNSVTHARLSHSEAYHVQQYAIHATIAA